VLTRRHIAACLCPSVEDKKTTTTRSARPFVTVAMGMEISGNLPKANINLAGGYRNVSQ